MLERRVHGLVPLRRLAALKIKYAAIGLAAGLFVSQGAVPAKFVNMDIEDVPIDRLLSNLEKYEAYPPPIQGARQAHLEFEIGRLHSMAYARKTETAKKRRSDPYYGPMTDYQQFKVVRTSEEAQNNLAQDHLKKAIAHLENAANLDSSLDKARLGLA